VRSEIAVRIDLTSVVVGGLVFDRSDDQDSVSRLLWASRSHSAMVKYLQDRAID